VFEEKKKRRKFVFEIQKTKPELLLAFARECEKVK